MNLQLKVSSEGNSDENSLKVFGRILWRFLNKSIDDFVNDGEVKNQLDNLCGKLFFGEVETVPISPKLPCVQNE